MSRCCAIGQLRCLWLCSAGINQIRVRFERNFYLTDEQLKAKCFVDNTKSSATCSKIIIRLIRTIKAFGVPLQPNPNNNR